MQTRRQKELADLIEREKDLEKTISELISQKHLQAYLDQLEDVVNDIRKIDPNYKMPVEEDTSRVSKRMR